MNIQQLLNQRSDDQCELCAAKTNLSIHTLIPEKPLHLEHTLLICETCQNQINNPNTMDKQHWQCLNASMWSTELPVKIMAWRILNCLSDEAWAQDLLDMLYLEPQEQDWAASSLLVKDTEQSLQTLTLDNNGIILNAGDSVTLIKDLTVKGAGFTAKRGTVVKNIVLTDNPKHIEGRVNGIRIVLVADYLKKVT